MKKFNYINRTGVVNTFTVLKNGDLLWEADFTFHRFSNNDNMDITMVDPWGGPYLAEGIDLEHIHKDLSGKVIEKFIINKDRKNYQIIIKK